MSTRALGAESGADIPLSTSLIERFWKKVSKPDDGDQSCWLWTGAKGPKGYGIIGKGGRGNGNLYAHRVSFVIHEGPIAPGHVVCHRCDNPPCVNPKHLFLGTQNDNVQDTRNKGRCRYNSPRKLSDADVFDILSRLHKNEGVRSIARLYNVSPPTIREIRGGQIHRSLVDAWHLGRARA